MSVLLSIGSVEVSPAMSSLVGLAWNDNSCSPLVIEPVLAGSTAGFFSPGFFSPSLFSKEVVTSGQGLALLAPTSAERMRLQ
jgi:hypothetical protein